MLKHDSLDMELTCVNPYEVITPVMQDESNWQMSSGTDKATGLEMEKFLDLTMLFSKTSKQTDVANFTDELNTPIIDKEEFNFTSFINNNSNMNNQHVIEKSTINEKSSVNKIYYDIISVKEQQLEYSENNILQQANITSDMDATTAATYNLINIDSPCSDQTFVPLYLEDSALSVNGNEQFALSPIEHPGLVTPEDSNSSISTEAANIRSSHVLKLNTELKSSPFIDVLSTPDVLDTVVKLEEGRQFNILDIVKNEDIISVEDFVFPESNLEYRELAPHELEEELATSKRQRKRKWCDEDEDYVPPEKSKKFKQRSVAFESESENSDEEYVVKRKGRPPKRNASISSEGSCDVNKYRELRDKNNEASRKSRLKRKLKEKHQEKEMDELMSKNVRLKAEVSELDKMVNNFRKNLFSIMMSK